MAEIQCSHGSDCQCRAQPSEMDLDVTRTFSLLLVTLVLPMYLALSVLTYSMAVFY